MQDNNYYWTVNMLWLIHLNCIDWLMCSHIKKQYNLANLKLDQENTELLVCLN